MRVSEALRIQGEACGALGSPMYAELCARLSADAESGGPTATLLAGHEDDPGPSALGIRLLGSIHRLVLAGRAPELAAFYPSAGGAWETEPGWTALRRLIETDPGAVGEWLEHPPQTNEVGRSAALMGGLLHLEPEVPVRLREIGASGGLNLRADRYAYRDQTGSSFGEPGSALVIEDAWRGRALVPRPVRILDRVGCDLRPVDPTTAEGRLVLTAYTWPDQQPRLRRLRAAFTTAATTPVELRQQDAGSFVRDLDLQDGTVTVLWHSIMWQYLAQTEQQAVSLALEELGSRATPDRRLAHLAFEPTRRTPEADHEFLVVLRTWPGGERRILGGAPPHGLPVTWE